MLQYFSIQSTKRDAIQQHDYTTAKLLTEEDLKTCYSPVVLDDFTIILILLILSGDLKDM